MIPTPFPPSPTPSPNPLALPEGAFCPRGLLSFAARLACDCSGRALPLNAGSALPSADPTQEDSPYQPSSWALNAFGDNRPSRCLSGLSPCSSGR